MITEILNFLDNVNSTWFIFASLVIVLLFGIFLLWLIQTRIFKYRLRRIIKAHNTQETEEAVEKFQRHYPADRLMLYSKRMERYSRQMGPQIVKQTGLADKWVHKLGASALPRIADLRRVLLYCPESALFKAFLAAGRHLRLRKFFFEWMQNKGEEKVIRLLAESCRGEDFDPAICKSFLTQYGTLLRELTGEPEWYVRYFAYRILLLDETDLTVRSLEAGLLDPHSLVRKILAENFIADREKIWAMLWDKLIHDPVFEVRQSARKRIAKEFMDLYSPKDKDLSIEETFCILELLDSDSQEDRAFAASMLENDDKELRYPAAVFLEKCGILSSYLAKNTFDDSAEIDRNVDLLLKALDVNVSGFLKDYPSGDGAPLLAVARLLAGPGETHENICNLAKKVFAFFGGGKKIEPLTSELYTKTLEIITAKGDIKAFELFAEELSRRETEPIFLELLLPRLPIKAESIFSPVLFRFLQNRAFIARDKLEQILVNFRPDIILPESFRVLNGSRAEFPHEVRISALKILIQLRLPFCLERILESLPTFRPEEIESIAPLIADYPQDVFIDKAKTLLASPDARIRASLILILPATKNEGFIKEIRASLKDFDPDVRVAAIKALLGFGEIKLLNQETSMLHDPVERVRLATAEVIARHGNAAALEILRNITTDANETDVVKAGVIAGLGQAVNAEGISILISVLDSIDEFREQAEKALAKRTAKRDITRLIEIFKDAEPQLREKLIPVFKGMGKEAEPRILEILKDEVASFKPYLVKILEETGYVEETIRHLSHRDVEVRREAAMMLSLLDTLPAFRGLVLAVKDPDQEVRVCVVKALEKLKNSQSGEILEKLKDDPDSRIRKYVYWALERLDSLKME
jgi:HEAT repeat protein